MAAEFGEGTFKIISITEGFPPTGVDRASSAVRLNGQSQTWTFVKVDDSYFISTGGNPFTGIQGDNVIVSIDPLHEVRWHFTQRGDGYTIEKHDDQSKGWTVSGLGSDNPVIKIQSITSGSEPTQLFNVELVV